MDLPKENSLLEKSLHLRYKEIMMRKIIAEKSQSDLKMKDIYFSHLECIQRKNIYDVGKMDLSVNYQIEIKGFNDEPNTREIIIAVTINENKEKIAVKVVANGIFELNNTTLSEEEKITIFKYNAVAIMFPFIRSQVSVVTTQPGIMPILLQPINVVKLWETSEN